MKKNIQIMIPKVCKCTSLYNVHKKEIEMKKCMLDTEIPDCKAQS